MSLAPDFIELHAHWAPSLSVAVPEGRTIVLGRGQWQLTSTSISRSHCELFWQSLPKLRVSANKKPVWLSQGDHDSPEQVDPGNSGVVRSSSWEAKSLSCEHSLVLCMCQSLLAHGNSSSVRCD